MNNSNKHVFNKWNKLQFPINIQILLVAARWLQLILFVECLCYDNLNFYIWLRRKIQAMEGITDNF